MDSEQGPGVLIEQHIRQPHRHSLPDTTISALPRLRVPLPALPTSQLLVLFSFLRVLFGGGPFPARCCHWQSAVAKVGGVSEGTSLPASFLSPFVRASPQAPIPIN